MEGQDYVYAVARIRAKELTLLNGQDMARLAACGTYEECVRILAEKGWASQGTAEEMLSAEREKTWALLEELSGGLPEFDIFLYQNDYHNLKAAVKQVSMNTATPKIYMKHCTVQPEIMEKAIRENDFSLLPEQMRSTAQNALDVFLHTRDGQLCDILIDRAALIAIREAAKASGNEVLKKYAELTVARADIKIAARAAHTGKNRDFLTRALAPCETLDLGLLMRAAVSGFDQLLEYIKLTDYAPAAAALQDSVSAFELWCDNRLMEQIRPQKYNSFGAAPLAAYLLARESEIRTVRIILSGLVNHFSEQTVRERLRETYV